MPPFQGMAGMEKKAGTRPAAPGLQMAPGGGWGSLPAQGGAGPAPGWGKSGGAAAGPPPSSLLPHSVPRSVLPVAQGSAAGGERRGWRALSLSAPRCPSLSHLSLQTRTRPHPEDPRDGEGEEVGGSGKTRPDGPCLASPGDILVLSLSLFSLLTDFFKGSPKPAHPQARADTDGRRTGDHVRDTSDTTFFFPFFHQIPLIWPSFRYPVFILRMGGGSFHWEEGEKNIAVAVPSGGLGLGISIPSFPTANTSFFWEPWNYSAVFRLRAFFFSSLLVVVWAWMKVWKMGWTPAFVSIAGWTA